MKMAFLQQQHEKCLKAIELIRDCERRIKNSKKDLEFRNKWGYPTDFTEEIIVKYATIQQRLVQYYQNQFLKMVDMAVEAANI